MNILIDRDLFFLPKVYNNMSFFFLSLFLFCSCFYVYLSTLCVLNRRFVCSIARCVWSAYVAGQMMMRWSGIEVVVFNASTRCRWRQLSSQLQLRFGILLRRRRGCVCSWNRRPERERKKESEKAASSRCIPVSLDATDPRSTRRIEARQLVVSQCVCVCWCLSCVWCAAWKRCFGVQVPLGRERKKDEKNLKFDLFVSCCRVVSQRIKQEMHRKE